MFRTVCTMLCSLMTLFLITNSASSAPQTDPSLPPPITKEITHNWPVAPNWKTSTYMFHKEEFINPKIVEEMQGPLSDSGPQLLSVNVHNANISNQFFSQVHVRKTNAMPYVYYKERDKEFGYIFVGATSNGINVVHTLRSEAGSGIFHTLLFFIFTDTDSMSFGMDVTPEKQPTLTLIGALPLGNKFIGTISLKDDVLTVLPPEMFAQPLPLYTGGLILRFK